MSSHLPRDRLLADLRDFASDLGETPTRTAMNADGPHSSTPYEREFGGWTAALRAAGLEPNHEIEIDDERLVAELRRLADDLGRVPRFEDMAERGEFSPHTYVRRWGSWPEAKAAAGLDPATRTSRRIDRDDLLDAIHELAADLGHAPTQTEMNNHGRYSQRPYYREWDSWTGVLEAAGFEPNHRNSYEESELITEMMRLAEEFGYPPTMQQMRDHGRYSPEPFLTTFGSWVNAWDAAGLERREGNHAGRASREELLEELERVADEVDSVPTRDDMLESGVFSHEPYVREFGSWSGALEALGYSPYRSPDDPHGPIYYGPNWLDQREKALRRDGWRCRECGLTMKAHRCIWEGALHVHHETKFREFEDCETANRLENLVTLCRTCHYNQERK
jgi:hypothetical protein